MKEPVEIILLPTEEEPNIGDLCTSIRPNYSDKPLIFGEFENSYQDECCKQYLYITVSQEVEKGKEIYYIDEFTKKVTSSGGAAYGSKQDVIIATTDPKLTIFNTIDDKTLYIPQVQQSFLKEYCENPYGEFEVEYKIAGSRGNTATPELFYKLKLNQDNEVTITLMKEKVNFSGLYLVTYNAKYEAKSDAKSIEGVTDNPKKWIENHNKDREADGQPREEKDEFDFDTINISIFNTSVEEKMYNLEVIKLAFCEGRKLTEDGWEKEDWNDWNNWIKENL